MMRYQKFVALFFAASSSAPAFACDFPVMQPNEVKQLVINVLAQRLDLKPEEISQSGLTEPVFHKPFGETGPDCSGLWAMHHTLGYRFVWYEGSSCTVEGSAAIMGATSSAPVEVSFRIHCRDEDEKTRVAKLLAQRSRFQNSK